MILADTHVVIALCRPTDADRARELALAAEASAASGEPLVVLESVLCEAAWVLVSAFGMRPAVAATVLGNVLSTEALVPWNAEIAFGALETMAAEPKLDIADCILATHARRRGAGVATMDRRLQRAVQRG